MTFDFERIRGTHLETILEVLDTQKITEFCRSEKGKAFMREINVKEHILKPQLYVISKYAGFTLNKHTRVKEIKTAICAEYKDLVLSGMKKSSAVATLMIKHSCSYTSIQSVLAHQLKEGDD
jgi:hypothetical protein